MPKFKMIGSHNDTKDTKYSNLLRFFVIFSFNLSVRLDSENENVFDAPLFPFVLYKIRYTAILKLVKLVLYSLLIILNS